MANPALAPASLAASRQPSSSASGPVTAPARFHEVLQECNSAPGLSWPQDAAARKHSPLIATVLAPAWSWLKRKYPVAAEKRMRLAENIPLGEKRFVALVTVGNREFLIGGAASNVSLLSQWESTANSPASGKQTLVMRESFE
ncbi:MAG: flagellar biosynthetic protein FliO [Terracidiphilus sp.]